jgi:peptide/nickel transport system permease protein
MVIVFPSIWWGYMPPIMLIKFNVNPLGNLEMFVIPALVLGMGMAGQTMRMTRTMMLEVLRQDYIRTAWSKGLRERVVVLRHALKNALIPVITITGQQIGGILAGTVIIENIFQLPGMGQLITNATTQRDYTVVSSVLFIFAIVMVVANLFVDVTYSFLDPRVHYK